MDRPASTERRVTAYPLDMPIYDWVQAQGYWQPQRVYQTEARFIQTFSSAYLPHCHYADGKKAA